VRRECAQRTQMQFTTSDPFERFGKSSAVLARCQDSNQAAFEPLFQKATSILNLYREILNARHIVPMDLPKSSESTRSMTPKPSAQP